MLRFPELGYSICIKTVGHLVYLLIKVLAVRPILRSDQSSVCRGVARYTLVQLTRGCAHCLCKRLSFVFFSCFFSQVCLYTSMLALCNNIEGF